MLLKRVRVQKFRNFVDPQTIDIEDDVTALVGKNESGKTTILQALHRLKAANLPERFDLVTEYPRWRLSNDRKADPDIENNTRPVEAWFDLEDEDLDAFEPIFPAKPLAMTECYIASKYNNGRMVGLQCPIRDVLEAAVRDADVDPQDAKELLDAASADAAKTLAKASAKVLREGDQGARSKALSSFPSALDRYGYLTGSGLTEEQIQVLLERVPAFFYFSDYDLLPGEQDLEELASKIEAETELEPAEESVKALLSYANTTAEDFLGSNYDARKAELQASASGLTQKVFDYWRQNRDLEVEFDTDVVKIGVQAVTQQPVYHRFLKVNLKDHRHGGISTNFETRSAGFRWFFSFLAAFSEFQASADPIIVLLDEPGTSLHGEAQKDFLRFIFEELGSSKQVIYTTHSQYLVDPSKYEKLRAVEDRSTRQNPDLGVAVTNVDISTDPDTLLPIQAALGYSISQHLFLGAGRHLTVEGGSDFVYLQRLSEHLESKSRTGLDPRLSIIPLGGASNTPAFVALFAKHMRVSVLLDGDRNGKDAKRVIGLAAEGKELITEDEIVVVADVPGLPVKQPDTEDLFHSEDYLRLYNWAFNKNHVITDLPQNDERILRRLEALDAVMPDHAPPAYELTRHKDEFFATVKPETLERFEELIKRLNATISPDE
jgi:energy-coupling factor transporter ATP-binding protein EcfA2